MSNNKLWTGLTSGETAGLLDEFNASIGFDYRLYKQDIEGSKAHARMLSEVGIISKDEAFEITRGLDIIQEEIEADIQAWVQARLKDEDIHMAIERRLTELIGDAGRKLHSARSRNDQVALDLRMWLREELHTTLKQVNELRATLINKADNDLNHILPGYTHLQHAQPISLGHYWLAHEAKLSRDASRLEDCYDRMNVNPLGSGALSGTSCPIDRESTTKALGFSRPSENSLDAVSDRDYVAEYEFTISMIMVHLSQLAEEMILWSTREFGFIEISDAYATGSSMMPQKKNPDIPELVRGKTGRVIGTLQALLVTLKGLPLAYNKDLQEDKEMLFQANDTVQICLRITKEFLEHITANKERMHEAIYNSYADATDAAEYLVRKGVPFRVAYEAVGKAVKYAIERKRYLKELSVSEWQSMHQSFTEDMEDLLKPEVLVDSRRVTGGTARTEVMKAINYARKRLGEDHAT